MGQREARECWAWLTELVALIACGVSVTCKLRCGEQPWGLLYDVDGEVQYGWEGCLCPSCSSPGARTEVVGGAYLVVRGVPWWCWSHSGGCDVCLIPLSKVGMQRFLQCILPFFMEQSGAPVRYGEVLCARFVFCPCMKRRMFRVAHQKVMGCCRVDCHGTGGVL